MPKVLLRSIRKIILTTSFLLALAVYIFIHTTIPHGTLQTIKLTQIYALLAVTYLYFALLASPLYHVLPVFPSRGLHVKARRALGQSVFLFASLHVYFAFFGQLGGFSGLQFLSNKYLFAISLSFTAFIILALMTATSFNVIVAKLGRWWKRLHRFVYLAAFLITIHALLLGTHFATISDVIPQLFSVALALLLLLEAIRFDDYLSKKFALFPRFGFAFIIVVSFIVSSLLLAFSPATSSFSFNIHAQHIQLAQSAQNGLTTIPSNFANIPSLRGDRTKRFTVSFYHPGGAKSQQDIELSFKVYDANSGNQIFLYNKIYEKFLHLIIVDNELTYFAHIHPEFDAQKGFVITTQFPHDGVYHLYLDFQPFQAIEQQFAFSMNVGTVDKPILSSAAPDNNLTKTFGEYEVTMSYPKPLKSQSLSIGEQKVTFSIKDAKTKQPITTLKPYLAAFGHLVMINKDTYAYLHVHPTNLTPPAPNANGGPTVEFLPLGLYGPIKPGIYRVFAQFNPNGKLIVTDFTIKVE